MKKNNLFSKSMLKNIDWFLLIIVVAIVIYGAIAVTSATSPGFSGEDMSFEEYLGQLDWSYAGLQLIVFGIGVAAIIVLSFLDYNNLRDFSNIMYWIMVALLVAVWLFGQTINGTTGWFKIGNRGIQPAELCKILMIVVLAKEFAQRTEGKTEGITRFRDIWPMLWRFLIPFGLILLQPDWGSAMVYAVVFIGLLFMSKTSFKIIGSLLGGALAMLPVAWLFMADYQKERIYTFFDPSRDTEGSGFHMLRAKIVGSSGGLNGKGLFSDDLLTQQGNYLPEKQTDFIFAATSEAVGFVGGMILIILYGLLIYRLIRLSMRAKDDFGTYLILGVSFMLLFHVFENIGMNIGLMPVTGIPLPLFSYGGSNMLTMMLALGLVLNVNMRRTRYNI